MSVIYIQEKLIKSSDKLEPELTQDELSQHKSGVLVES